MSAHAEIVILRHELAEARRKLKEAQDEAERLRKDNADLVMKFGKIIAENIPIKRHE